MPREPMIVWILGIVISLIRILIWVIIIDAVLTWIPQVDRRHPIVRALRRFTEPIYAPFRKLVPPEKTGFLDLSPLIAILALNLLMIVLAAFARAVI